ncbi:unnamed protein product [Prorocentrum cordatum]|uniref:Uncharacterized protein n=1 Tax=Prorocentrum cordatum TaxID=2364126 RepID=A0ABN9Y9L5_9DINO|nr:unnamed protein product [Polarella glacialis]
MGKQIGRQQAMDAAMWTSRHCEPEAPLNGRLRQQYLAKKGIRESTLERGAISRWCFHSNVDDLLVVRKTVCPSESVLEDLQESLRSAKRDAAFEHCGVQIEICDRGIRASQVKAEKAVEHIDVSLAQKESAEELVTQEELSGRGSTSGQLQWLAHRSRPGAQRTPALIAADLIAADNGAGQIKDTIERALYCRKGAARLEDSTALAYGGSSFVSVEGEKSQAGAGPRLTNDPRCVILGGHDKQVPPNWASCGVKHAARPALAAEAYGIREAMEHHPFLRHFVFELYSDGGV